MSETPEWLDDKGKIIEHRYCQCFLEQHPLLSKGEDFFTTEGVYYVARMLVKQHDVEVIEVKDYIREPKENGYRSLHVIITVEVDFAEASRKVPVEIQIRTIAMDFWASTEHQLRYKKDKEFSEAERQEIARIVGLGALKYFILKVDARKNMLFNPAESIDFNGNTGPFIQYTYARIRSILRKAEAAHLTPSSKGVKALNDKETELIQKLADFKTAVADAGENYNPAGIANYCYELTKLFNQFYHDYSILSAETDEAKAFRLMLAANVGKTIKNGMALLGIEVPERM